MKMNSILLKIGIGILFTFAIIANVRLISNRQTGVFPIKLNKANASITPITKANYMSAVCGCGSWAFEDWEACCCPGETEPCYDNCNSIQYGCP